MKISTMGFTRYSLSATLSLYCILGTAASIKVPEACSSSATSSCCYAVCLAMAENKQYVHGDPSAKLTCKKKCMPNS